MNNSNDSGLDFCSTEELEIDSGESKLIQISTSVELPPETEAEIRPKSRLALKHQITVLSTPSTVDEGYRVKIGVILINHGKHSFQVTKGMKIA